MTSQLGHSFSDETNFCYGQTFIDKKELKMLLHTAAARQSFDNYMEKSSTKFNKAKCLSRGCGWLLQAKKYETSDRFWIYNYVGLHTCGVEHATRRHKKVSFELIALVCVNYFRDSKGPSIREIQRIVFKDLCCNVSYWICWKGSVIEKNIIRWTPKRRCACVPAFFHMHSKLAYGNMPMRKVIAVDGTHLYDKYGGVLLSAIAQDTENHIFLIAFCVVDKEDDASWTFFFQKLKSIVEDKPDLCVISDKYISIVNVFSCVYSRAHHGLCMRHLTENPCINQHCREHFYLFYAAVKTYSFDKFSDNFIELKSKCPEAGHVLKNALDFEKWGRAHFLSNRYDVITTNIVESLNSILMDEREYPVSYIFNSITKKFGEKFRERHAFVDGKENIFVPYAERILRIIRA
ncbi:uncharacterized protein LOC107858253 [Capsicum annuum]|uniref:uncharacterized protein LOC107858253 n=1 Tax=Capsicum annuum TaxID=4072 RepID=UPI001FB17917|nr:uncharacterized protein LOC107858253 [Capsicum annuum]